MKNSRFSRVSEALSGLIDLIVASLLWVLCSLPVFTLGASTTALYYAVVKCVRHNRGRLTATFIQGFKSNFRQATLVWLLFLLYYVVMAGDAYAFGLMGFGPDTVLYALSRLLFLPPLFLFPWVFAYLSRFENTLSGSLKFSAWLMLRNSGKSLLLGLMLALFLLISWLLPQLFPILPGPVCLLMSLTVEPVFRRYQAETTDQSVDAWFNE